MVRLYQRLIFQIMEELSFRSFSLQLAVSSLANRLLQTGNYLLLTEIQHYLPDMLTAFH
jgi:hypothetical protein